MSTLPRFVFPMPEESRSLDSTLAIRKDRPQIQLITSPEVREQHTLTLPGQSELSPLSLRTFPTPPNSPTHLRSFTTSPGASPKMYGSGATTPPPTPTHASHSKTDSASSDFLNTINSLRRGDSSASSNGRISLDEATRPGSTEPILFPSHTTDYKYQTDEEGRKSPIGVGAWSDVYLAMPGLPDPATEFPLHAHTPSALTPPITPVHSRDLSLRKTTIPLLPPMYAVKVPSSTSAKKVLTAEARVLSYLSRYPDAEKHTVPFYGQDIRTGALILKAMDGTLEDWIQNHLNTLDNTSRAAKLAAIFPTMTLSLIDSLIWMQEKNCIHADIKPSNILTSSSTTSTSSTPIKTPSLVFSDFSSTILTTLSTSTDVPAPMGAGTWEYLDPTLLSTLHPSSPSPATDLWSLAITLLFLILGQSPFEAFKHNKFQQREMIKAGAPLQCLTYDDVGIANLTRLKRLSKDLGLDLGKWFGRVLRKSVKDRVEVAEWREEFVRCLAEGRLKM